jgi:DNA segregation ATPase FtsK/SpoIIIE-like protein
MALLRSLGALAFVLGVALLALDGARALNTGQFEATSLERFWNNLGGDGLFQMRLYFMDWFGSMAEKILDLPAAFIAFGIGMTLLIAFDGVQRDKARKPLLF